MASFNNLPKSNESNIIGHHCSNCGHKNYIMITSVNLTNNDSSEEMDIKQKPFNYREASAERSDTNETHVKKSASNIPFNESKFKSDLKSLVRIPPNAQIGNTIGKYFINSEKEFKASKSNLNKNLQITNIYSPYKKDRAPQLDKSVISDRRLLLWFGTKKQILFQILNNGFQFPLINGKFGNGFYFSDRVSESIKHCDQNNGYLIICEVAVGKMFRTAKTKEFSSAPNGFESIKAVGKYMAEKESVEKYNIDVIVPIGKTVPNPKVSQSEFNFNKYVVFEKKRFQIRFIVEFESN